MQLSQKVLSSLQLSILQRSAAAAASSVCTAEALLFMHSSTDHWHVRSMLNGLRVSVLVALRNGRVFGHLFCERHAHSMEMM